MTAPEPSVLLDLAERHRFQLWQDGIMVAAVDCANRHSAMKEIAHYAAMYEQDGPVQIREVKRRARSTDTVQGE